MTKKRFFKKEYPYDWWFVFDREQEYVEDMKIPFETDYGNFIAMSEDQVIDELNNLNDENQAYKQKVKEILQKAYDKSNEGVVYRLDLAGHKYIGQQQRIAILKLLKDIAKDLGVELND